MIVHTKVLISQVLPEYLLSMSGSEQKDGSLPDCNNDAVIGKVGCHVVAWAANTVVPFCHKQMPCTQIAS